MTCKKCGYDFVFDPKRHQTTDGKFLATVHRASSNDTYHFTANQLYAAACRRLRGSLIPLIFFVMVAFVTFIVLFSGASPPIGVLLFIGLFTLILALGSYYGIRPKLPRKKWNKHLKRWQKLRPPLRKLIRSPELNSPPPECDEPDIYDYGVEQVLICEREEVVDWLVLNRYHVTTKTAVISEDGYPHYLIPKIQTLLASEHPPTIYLLHDSGHDSQSMITRVRESQLFDLYEADIIDLGLTPDLVPKIKSLKNVRRSLKSDTIPVDTIPFGTLTTMTTCAFASHCAFTAFQSGSAGETSMEFETSCSDDGDGE
ncbi:MAG: hypothetical protein ACI8XO_002153 [Verrucomicrobiales bacterium]|jgi:hypothetical protein